MIPLKLAIRPLFRKGEHSAARIVSLATGLAFGLLLLSEVFYQFSYDGFYPDARRIYTVNERFKMDKASDKLETYPRVSGAIGPGLLAEVPGVELACRLNAIGENVIYTEAMNRLEGRVSLADEYVFDLLPRPMRSGDAKVVLQTPMACLVSTKIADAMGGNVVGQTLTLKRFPGKTLTIGGVFEALPENTNYEYDLLISMVSTDQFTWDGTQNWMGNDRYYTCVRLKEGATPESLAPAVRQMQVVHQDIERLEEENGGIVLEYAFLPLRKMHSDQARDMIVILITISLAVLFVSIMNYILLTLSALANRAKSSAVYKTFGAQSGNLQQLIFGETFLLFLLSLLGAIFLLAALKPFAESQLDHSLASALNPYVLWPLAGVVLALMGLTGILPGRFFARIPVATVFRKYRQGKNNWKLGLLAVQFMGSAFILVLMITVSLQYSNMKNADHGYQTRGIFYGSTIGMDGARLPSILDQLRALPGVERVGMGYDLPISGASGNNVLSPDGKRDLFNVADFYEADENFLAILGIEVREGQNFSPGTAALHDVLISDKGAGLLALNNGWTDGTVGKEVTITEHGATTIRGVYPDFVIGSLSDPDLRPSVFFYCPEEEFERLKRENPGTPFLILVGVQEGVEAGMLQKITGIFNQGMAEDDAEIFSLGSELQARYNAERGFRNAMMLGNVVIFLVTVIGLLGYTTSEANRRRKELAIRRISGANLSHILRVFIRDLEFLAAPSVVAGLVVAWFMVDKWMQNFANKIGLPWPVILVSSLFILGLVAVVAAINYTRTANRNPVEALRYE
ncbi:MAG: FtsX-like permease family protein [Bacteroidales bacterium]